MISKFFSITILRRHYPAVISQHGPLAERLGHLGLELAQIAVYRPTTTMDTKFNTLFTDFFEPSADGTSRIAQFSVSYAAVQNFAANNNTIRNLLPNLFTGALGMDPKAAIANRQVIINLLLARNMICKALNNFSCRAHLRWLLLSISGLLTVSLERI